VQREILTGVSLDVAYFRTWFGNFTITDDRAVGPADFDPFRITAPVDPRLPGGGGYVISGLYDLKPEKFGVAADNILTRADKFGRQIRRWNGHGRQHQCPAAARTADLGRNEYRAHDDG
jgi:hypothetical protein